MIHYRDGLHLIPHHMRDAVVDWIEKGEPHPSRMGSFFRAVFSNDLMSSFGHADHINRQCMFDWCDFLHNFAPLGSFGNAGNLLAWHARFHPEEKESPK